MCHPYGWDPFETFLVPSLCGSAVVMSDCRVWNTHLCAAVVLTAVARPPLGLSRGLGADGSLGRFRSGQDLGVLPPHLEASEGQAAEALGRAGPAPRPHRHPPLLLQGWTARSGKHTQSHTGQSSRNGTHTPVSPR